MDTANALDHCLQHITPEIILLDYNLPEINVAELAKSLRARYGLSLGLVMFIASDSAEDRIECRRAGADNYLFKPVDIQELSAVIDNLLPRIYTPSPCDETWTLNLARAELLPPDAAPIKLFALDMAIMKALSTQNHHQASREILIRALGKDPDTYDAHALEAGISRLRRKLPRMQDGRNPLQTLRGRGYQFLRSLVVK